MNRSNSLWISHSLSVYIVSVSPWVTARETVKNVPDLVAVLVDDATSHAAVGAGLVSLGGAVDSDSTGSPYHSAHSLRARCFLDCRCQASTHFWHKLQYSAPHPS